MSQADLVRRFGLWPRHKLVLQAKDIAAYDWAVVEPLNDSRPGWARPRVLFRFCDIDPCHYCLPEGFDPRCESAEVAPIRRALWNDVFSQVQHHFTLQQLTSLYVVFVRDNSTFSVTRWDRSGVVVTELVDFADQPDSLSDLFWHMSMLTDAELGFDPTATPVLPGSSDYALMDQVSQPREDDIDIKGGTVVEGDVTDPTRSFHFVRMAFRRMLTSSSQFAGGHPRWKLSVPVHDGQPHEFLVCAPLKYDKGEVFDWRNTRGYLAVDCQTLGFVFLKDTWRESGTQINGQSEGACLAMLNKAGVRHVPTLLCHADLHDTITPLYHNRDDREGPEWRRHYRVVVREFCLPLPGTANGRQFVSAVRDCISGKLLSLCHRSSICSHLQSHEYSTQGCSHIGRGLAWRSLHRQSNDCPESTGAAKFRKARCPI